MTIAAVIFGVVVGIIIVSLASYVAFRLGRSVGITLIATELYKQRISEIAPPSGPTSKDTIN